MGNKGFSLIVVFSVALHAVVLYGWTMSSFEPPVLDMLTGDMSVALAFEPEPIEEPVELIEKPPEEPVELVEKPVEEPVELVEEPVEEPVELIEKPVEEPVELVEKPVEEPVELVEKPVEEPVELVEKPVEEPVELVPEPVKAIVKVAEPVEVKPVAASVPSIGVRTDPSPLEELNKPPLYPGKLGRRLHGETVLLEVQVLADGSVGEIRMEKASRYSLANKAVLKAVKNWKYRPAKRDGLAVEALHQERIVFEYRPGRGGSFGRD